MRITTSPEIIQMTPETTNVVRWRRDLTSRAAYKLHKAAYEKAWESSRPDTAVDTVIGQQAVDGTLANSSLPVAESPQPVTQAPGAPLDAGVALRQVEAIHQGLAPQESNRAITA